jgi:monoterpene epsilon-lactone hydrolase
LTAVGAQLRLAVDAVLAGAIPASVLVKGMRDQDPVPAGPPVELAPLASGGAVGWLGPRDAPGVIVYFHGGGGLSGSVNGQRPRAESLGAASGQRIFAVEYRLAPEHPFPCDIEDAVCAYRTLLEQGVSPERVAFAGDSHGAGVAASALLRLRDDGDPLPTAAFLACGVFDRTVVMREGFLEREVTWTVCDPMLAYGPFLRWLCQTYLGGVDPADPLASPLLADLGGLPPLLVQAGEMEVLRGQSERLVRSVREAGGEAELDLVPEMFHNFHAFELRAAREALAKAAGFLALRLG